MTVRVVQSVARRHEPALRVMWEEDSRQRLCDLPAWMVDSAVCASMRAAESPVVSFESLRSLKDLLRRVAAKDAERVVEDHPFDSRSKGDVDAKTLSSPSSRSAGPVWTSDNSAAVEDVTGGGQAAGKASPGQASEGVSRQRLGSARQGGGVR
jgi:hypothetical protein